jgi:hypothetical protein
VTTFGEDKVMLPAAEGKVVEAAAETELTLRAKVTRIAESCILKLEYSGCFDSTRLRSSIRKSRRE